MAEYSGTRAVAFYVAAETARHRVAVVLNAVVTGLWLGVLSREQLHALDAWHYAPGQCRRNGDADYYSDEWNTRGLFSWEQQAVTDHFGQCHRLLVLGAGGGREMVALARLGYEVVGCECNPELVATANTVLRNAGIASEVTLVGRDVCPDGPETYDGIVVGWASYMLVQGSSRRIALLRRLRERVAAGGPILLSFFARSGASRRFKVVAGVGSSLRWLRRRPPVEVGDYLSPNFVHFFTEGEIASELAAGGFDLTYYSAAGYGHAVGHARAVS